jgi:hypothetical protein
MISAMIPPLMNSGTKIRCLGTTARRQIVRIYNAFKWAALRCRDAGFPELEKKMRTQPDNPVSEPGGTDWAYRGLKDGISIDGKKKVGPKPKSAGHGLKLTALDSATTCVST